ncbi:MAG: hypothetical protein D6785_11595 [Planctomycetota bacterium]|nr:MAG: hypothetical protein D6785_11595 [Planctomycetota bacterium]
MYMAPETLEGKPVDARSDIYSLGVTLYYGLTGVNPFAAPSPLEIISRHLQGNYKPLEEMGYFPKELSVFLKKLLARNPDDRPKNMEEVSKTLLKLEKKVQGVSLSSLLYRIKFPSFRQLGSYLKEGLAHPYSPYVLGFLGTLIFISLIWYVVSASLSSSRIPKRTRQGPFHSSYWEVLKKKTKVNLKKGLLDQAKFDLEEGKKYLPAPLMVQWRSLYDQIQKKIDSEKKAFQRALKEAEDYRVRNQFAQGISILRRFLNSGVISVADSSRNAIQKIKKEEKDFFEKEKKKIFIKIQNYAFLEALQECHWLSEKLSPHFHKDWQDFYEQVKIKMSKKFQQNFKQKKWFQLLEWYESLRNQPDSDLREKIEREYNNLKKHIQSSYQAFYSAYQKSFQWEKQGDYNRAIQVLLSFSKKYPSFFKDIIQGRVRRLQETQNQLPPRSHLVYGIYRSYIDGLIGTQSETYSLPRRLRKKVLKELKVGEGLEFILKGSKVKDIRKSHIAKVLAILETLKKEVPITIILKKGNPIHGILLGYSYSEILVGRKTNNLFLRIHAISWKDIQSLQVKE